MRALAEKAETWRGGADSKSRRDWRSTMAAYVLPELGRMHIGAVATSDVKRVLRPLAWFVRILFKKFSNKCPECRSIGVEGGEEFRREFA